MLLDIPPLLDFPAPQLRAYPRETVVAEKLEAMVKLGMANSRMKDFYDLAVLARSFAFDGELLSRAVLATDPPWLGANESPGLLAPSHPKRALDPDGKRIGDEGVVACGRL
jgi:hypothetical protein